MIDWVIIAIGLFNLAGIIVMWLAMKPQPQDLHQPLVKPDRSLLKPFAKPNGKHKPKTNDDRTAWEIENERR